MSIDTDALNNCRVNVEYGFLTIRTPTGQLLWLINIKQIGRDDGIVLGDILETINERLLTNIFVDPK